MTDQQRSALADPAVREPEPAPEYADPGGNDGYENPGAATGAAPVPPAIFPDQVEEVRGDAQGGDTGESASTQPAPGGGTPARVTGNYGDAKAEELEAEIEARRAEGRTIEVTGTGKDGNVVKSDLVSALEADDKARSEE